MRGIQTPVRNVRRRIFKEIAKFGYEQRNLQDLEDLPYEIIPEKLQNIEIVFTENERS